MLREFARAHQRRAADGRLRDVAFRQRQKLGVAPHIERAAGEILAPHGFLKGIVVKGNFQGGETVWKLFSLFSSFLRGASCPKSPRVAATAAASFMLEKQGDVKNKALA